MIGQQFKCGLQAELLGYDTNGVGRMTILAFMLIGCAISGAAQMVFTLFPDRVARPIDYYRDVMNGR